MRQPSCTFTRARRRPSNRPMPVGTSVNPRRASSLGKSRLSAITSTTPGKAAASSGARAAKQPMHDDLRLRMRLGQPANDLAAFRFALGRHGASVDDAQIDRLALGRLAIPQPLEPLPDELRFVLVHLAAEGDGLESLRHSSSLPPTPPLRSSPSSSPCIPPRGRPCRRRESDRVSARRAPSWSSAR